MELRRLAVISVIVLFALGSYSYLINRYNPDTVELYLTGNISAKDCEKLKTDNKDVLFGMNYTMRYRGSKLIMTTGLDLMMKELKLSKGSFLADMTMREAAVGDMAAEAFFKKSGVAGESMQIFGEDYEIKGIIKGSDEVYIPYSEKLDGLKWQKRILKCSINDTKRFYMELENLQSQIDLLGIEILDVVVYREELNMYRNVAVLAVAYGLLHILLMFMWRLRDRISMLRKEYLQNSRATELRKYLLGKARYILIIMFFCIIEITLIYVIYKLLSTLVIPPYMIPDNLFSPSSYINVAKLLYMRYFMRIENGIEGILVEIKIVNTAFAFLVLLVLVLRSGSLRRENLHCNYFSADNELFVSGN